MPELPSQAPLETMMERMTEGIFILDKNFKILTVNPACLKLLGLKGTPTLFDITEAFNGFFPIEETISQVFKTQDIEKVSEVKVGEKYFQITVIPLDIDGAGEGVGVLLHDQTEEQNLRHKHEEFMEMVVHELRSPLTVVKGMADMLIKSPENFDENKTTELLTQMRDSSAQLLEMVNSVLEDAKEDSTKFEIHKEMGDLNSLIEDEIKNYEGLANERGLTLGSKLDPSIPQFEFDPTKVTQVMNNLLSNAIKFTHEGGITVSTKKDSKNNAAVVEVADTGEGIPGDKKSQLFHKFAQLHKTDDPELPSTGLGLVITKGIVEAHGGKVWVGDNEPKGTKMIFVLPLNI